MDVHGTADRPAGPHPHPYEPRLVAWIKLEELEYMCKPHDTTIERIADSAKREQMTVNLAYAKGSTLIQVDQVGIPSMIHPTVHVRWPFERGGGER